MSKRSKMSRSKSKSDFRRKSRPHPKNGLPEGSTPSMRGGIRL